MRSVADVFGLHPLLIRGATQTHHRPKLDCCDDTLVLVLKTVDNADHDGLRDVRHFVETGEVMIAVGPGFVIAVRHGGIGLAEVRAEMHESPTILKTGTVRRDVRDRGARRRRLPASVGASWKPTSTQYSPTSSRPPSRPMSNRSTCSNVRLPSCATRSAHRPRTWGASVPTTAISSPAGSGAHRQRRRDHVDVGRRGARQDRAPAEQRHAQDLRLGRARRCADPCRRHLRHELRLLTAARALAVGLPGWSRRRRCASAYSCTASSVGGDRFSRLG
jgi:hypothetical protein